MKLPDKFLLYLLCVSLLGLFCAFRLSWTSEQKVPRGDEVTLVFNVEKEPRFFENYQLIYVGDAKIYSDLFPKFRVGDRLRVSGKADDSGRIFDPKIEKIGQSSTVFSKISAFRNKIAWNINSYLPEREATLVSGSVLGVDNISEDFRDELIETGTIHVVVVSGQNLMLVAGIFLSASRYLGRRVSLVLATFFVFAYALLTGFEPPVVRASLMVLISSVALYWGRETGALWSLLVAALVIIFVWPQAIFEVSFQLTFAATLGIMTMGQKLSKLWSRVPVFGENAAIATSAYIFTSPVIFYHFGRVSPLAPLANIFVAEAVFPIMVLGFLTAGASLVFAPLGQVFAYFAYAPAWYFVKVVEVLSNL